VPTEKGERGHVAINLRHDNLTPVPVRHANIGIDQRVTKSHILATRFHAKRIHVVTIGVLFVCTANICRSPMAEGAFRSMARRAGLDSAFAIDSAGTFDGHVGEPPTLRAVIAASRRGYAIGALRARQVVPADIARFDYVLAMDRCHLIDLQWMAPRALIGRLHLFTSFDSRSRSVDVADPYGGDARDFEGALDVIEAGCEALLKALTPLAERAASRVDRVLL
jgi:low molecular weight protein-tyrosine phosphatase